MPEPTHAGRRFLAPPHTVDAAQVDRYAAAVAGADVPYEPGTVPPTFAAVYCLMPAMAELFADPALGLDLAGLIHAEQSFEWLAPVAAGDVIDSAAEIVSVETRRGLTFVTVDLSSVARPGRPVCRGRALLLVRAGRP